MSDVAKAVKPLFDKFIDFFDIFDLSFFVSGATFVAAIAWAGLTPDLAKLIGFVSVEEALLLAKETGVEGSGVVNPGNVSGVGIAMLILASYVSGMTCFALGRFVRKWAFRCRDWLWSGFQRNRRSSVLVELTQHGVITPRDPNDLGKGFDVSDYGRRVPWLPRYFTKGGIGQESALYVRMWAEVRQRERYSTSFSLLRRYWVSSATLDGLFVAFVAWAMLLFIKLDAISFIALVPTIATAVGALFCLREAERYGVYQREELVATLIHGYDLPDAELGGMMSRVPEIAEPRPQTAAPAPDPAPDAPAQADE